MDLSVNKTAKSFFQNKDNDWFADQVFTQFQNGKDPTDVKISSKLSDLKPIHAKWIVDCCLMDFLKLLQNAEDIYEKIENPFRE